MLYKRTPKTPNTNPPSHPASIPPSCQGYKQASTPHHSSSSLTSSHFFLHAITPNGYEHPASPISLATSVHRSLSPPPQPCLFRLFTFSTAAFNSSTFNPRKANEQEDGGGRLTSLSVHTGHLTLSCLLFVSTRYRPRSVDSASGRLPYSLSCLYDMPAARHWRRKLSRAARAGPVAEGMRRAMLPARDVSPGNDFLGFREGDGGDGVVI